MIKLLSNSFDFGEPTLQVFVPGAPLTKRASEISDFLKTVQAEDGKTKLLVLAMGAGEAYGANRNGDYFHEDALIERHPTFEKYARWYKHHQNKDPEKSYGKVAKSFYNTAMKRVELLCEIDNAKNPDLVKRANAGEDIPVSMSCRVPYDICSICGNQAKTLGEYCGHLKESMTKILPDGRQVCAINPNPTFFDISEVFKPADRIAYVLDKVASVHFLPSAALALQAGLYEGDFWDTSFDKMSSDVLRKRALISKLAEIEKEIEAVAQKPMAATPREKMIKDEAPKALVVIMQTPSPEQAGGLKELMGGLAHRGVMMGPDEYSQAMTGGPCPEMKELLPGIFSRLLESPLLGEALGSRCPDLSSSLSALPGGLLDALAANRSLHEGPASRRILKITAVSMPELSVPKVEAVKTASLGRDATQDSDLAAQLAVGYALYKVAALDAALPTNDEFYPLLSVLQNYVGS